MSTKLRVFTETFRYISKYVKRTSADTDFYFHINDINIHIQIYIWSHQTEQTYQITAYPFPNLERVKEGFEFVLMSDSNIVFESRQDTNITETTFVLDCQQNSVNYICRVLYHKGIYI